MSKYLEMGTISIMKQILTFIHSPYTSQKTVVYTFQSHQVISSFVTISVWYLFTTRLTHLVWQFPGIKPH